MKSYKEQFNEFEDKLKYLQDVVGFSEDEAQELCKVALKWSEIFPYDVSESLRNVFSAVNGDIVLSDMSTYDTLRALSLQWNTKKSKSNRDTIRANQRKNKFKNT